MAMTPAIVVVLTAPRPTRRMPNLPSAEEIESPLVTGQNYIIRVSRVPAVALGPDRVLCRKNAMLKWFRQGLSPYQTPLAMVGVKSGDEVVVVGAADADLAAQLALVTGLNGQTLVVDRPDERGRVDAAAARAGALVEFSDGSATSLPVEAASNDVVVIAVGLGRLTADERARGLNEAMRVLRPGGRTIVIEGIKPPREAAGTDRPAIDDGEVLALLAAAGGRAVRTLATAGGRTYYEARKARGPDPA
jgi:SAM-dependent methyltransferase